MGRFSFLCANLLLGLVRGDVQPFEQPQITNTLSENQQENCIQPAICVPHIQCPAHFNGAVIPDCDLLKNGISKGLCCTTSRNFTNSSELRKTHLLTVDARTVGSLARHSGAELAKIRWKESRLLNSEKPSILQAGSASFSHFRNSRTFNAIDFSDVIDVSNRGLELALATKEFMQRQGIPSDQFGFDSFEQDLRPSALGAFCRPQPFCPIAPPKYRSHDGTCNNLQQPQWGSLMTPFSRLLPPKYSDGIWTPRVSVVNGRPLKSPRLISVTLFPDNDIPNFQFTLMLMQFGQFVSHDITQSIITSFQNGSAISCCSPDGAEELPPQFRHYACMPITIAPDDPFYQNFAQRCMNFVRSVLAPNPDCTLGYAQQMNKITSFIDGSAVYGSSLEQARELRSFELGRLRVFNDFGRDLLPLAHDISSCIASERGSPCFIAGDTRTNQMISLVVIHLIFLREHNRLANELAHLNPTWTDEILYQETRRIIIAELQVIIYNEFLPVILGPEAMSRFGLWLVPTGHYALEYDPTLNPSIPNEFASAAFRFGHSMVDGILKIYGPTRMEEMISIPEVMFHPNRIRRKPFLDELLSTLSTQPIQDVDGSITEGLTRYMFRAGNPFGIDLAALNIQRGRDHGLRSYNDYRQLIGMSRVRDFTDLGPELGHKLNLVYDSVDDIDLWVGGLLEEKAPDALVGPTFRDIIADTFYRLKKADRYFFQNGPDVNPGFFTREQLLELNKVSLARIVCDNRDGILLEKLPMHIFQRPGTVENPFVNCHENGIPRMNLLPWHIP